MSWLRRTSTFSDSSSPFCCCLLRNWKVQRLSREARGSLELESSEQEGMNIASVLKSISWKNLLYRILPHALIDRWHEHNMLKVIDARLGLRGKEKSSPNSRQETRERRGDEKLFRNVFIVLSTRRKARETFFRFVYLKFCLLRSGAKKLFNKFSMRMSAGGLADAFTQEKNFRPPRPLSSFFPLSDSVNFPHPF